MFILVVGLIYYFVPNAAVRFRDVWVGALLTGPFWKGALRARVYMRDMTRFTQVERLHCCRRRVRSGCTSRR